MTIPAWKYYLLIVAAVTLAGALLGAGFALTLPPAAARPDDLRPYSTTMLGGAASFGVLTLVVALVVYCTWFFGERTDTRRPIRVVGICPTREDWEAEP